jgi:hypothetical protein
MGGANTQSPQSNQHPDSIRTDGTVKGSGFLGGIKRIDDPSKVSSELSIGVDWGSGEKLIPQMVPTLDDNEINYLLSTSEDKIKTQNPDLNKSITQKAVRFAREREALGLPYFAQENESPKQKTNTMGGLNTKQGGTNQARRDKLEFEKNFTGNPPPMSEEELATYARIDAESDGANSYKRSASVIDPASVIKKNQELLKKPMSSYEAIDVGLK